MIPPRATEGESSNRALGGRRILARASPAAAHRSRAHDRIAEAARYCYYNTLNKRRPMYPADSDRRSPPPFDPADILKSLSHGYTHPVCIFMPRARARLFAFLVACVYAAICISPVSVPIGAATTLGNAPDGEGAGGRSGKRTSQRERERERGTERGALSSRLHRSAAGWPPDRSTANKSRRFPRRAARVRSCPAFRVRSVSGVRLSAAKGEGEGGRAGGRAEGAPTNNTRSLRVIFGGGLVFAKTMDDPPTLRRSVSLAPLPPPTFAVLPPSPRKLAGGRLEGEFNCLNILASGFLRNNANERERERERELPVRLAFSRSRLISRQRRITLRLI